MNNNLLVIGSTGSGKTALVQKLTVERTENQNLSVLWFDLLAIKAPSHLPIDKLRVVSVEEDFESAIAYIKTSPESFLVVLDGIDDMQLSESCWADIDFLLSVERVNFIVTAQSLFNIPARRRTRFGRMLIGPTSAHTINALFPSTDADWLAAQISQLLAAGERPVILEGELQPLLMG